MQHMSRWLLGKMDLTCVAVQAAVLPKTVGKKYVLAVQTKIIVLLYLA